MRQGANLEVATEFLTRVFGPVSEHPVYLSSLRNSHEDADEPTERHVATRNPTELARFIEKYDRARRGLFFCVSTLRPDAPRRAKDAISEITLLHADIDLKDVSVSLEEVVETLKAVRLPPSILVRSGNGIHAYWLLTEAFGLDDLDRVESTLKLLADTVGGDQQCTEASRLMRVPGTHNTKRGAFTPVVLEHADYNRRYELDDIEEWLAETSPVIRRKAVPAVREEASNPWLRVAERFGLKPPVDVEARLKQMSYQGTGDASIHNTQLAVTASLLSRGESLEDVVGLVLDATREAAGQFGERWNWRREEAAVRKMCVEWRRKHPAPAAVSQASSSGTRAVTKATAAAGGNVVSMADRVAERGKKAKRETADVMIAIAEGVIESIRGDGQDILLTDGECHIYEDGLWRTMSPADEQWIRTLIQTGCEALGEQSKTNTLNAAWKRLMEHPSLYRRKVDWNASGCIATPNGMLDPITLSFSPHSPSHYARRKIGAEYDPGAKCPTFTSFVDNLFADRMPEERAGLTATLQAFFGASLAVDRLSREERKALLLVGPSRTGKTEIARVFRSLIGDPVATPSVAEIAERFGLSSLYEAAAWIRDDAINEGDKLDPQRFKTIVTGEPIDIERKHLAVVRGVELTLPVLLTTNALPRSRDGSDAIFNRSLVLEMTNVISEEVAARIRAKAGVHKGRTIGQHIFELEASGILNWALAGLARLLEQGRYDLPESVAQAGQRFKDDNNPVGQWARTHLVKSTSHRILRADLLCAYHGWQAEEEGSEARALGARAFFPRLRAACPWIGDTTSDDGRRFVTGISLTDAALVLWERHNNDRLNGGAKAASLSKSEVNRLWNTSPAPGDANAPRF